jgi:hypothetical protein
VTYTIKVRCWYCRDIFPISVQPNEQQDKLLSLLLECPECQEQGALTVYRQQLGDVAMVNGRAPTSFAEIPTAQLAAHVFGAKQPV